MSITRKKVRSCISLIHAHRIDEVTGMGGCLKLSTQTMPIHNMGHERMATTVKEILQITKPIQNRNPILGH
jgi:hypothetical protein